MQYFVDTGFWIARLSRDDQWHLQAVEISENFKVSDRFFTSNFVLLELLNYFSSAGELHRANASTLVDWIEDSSDHRILTISSQLFFDARTMYRSHADKAWSLTDCSSFLMMQQLGLKDALTFDHHFFQAGYRIPVKV